MFNLKILGITGLLMSFIAVLLGAHLVEAGRAVPVTVQMEDMNMDAYRVNLSTDPAVVEAGKPFTLTVDIFGADGQTPIETFQEVHTKLLHLILVTEDLKTFLHVHPDYEELGRFTLKDLVLPEASNYVAFADFTPEDDHQQAVRALLSTKDAQPAVAELAVSEPETVVGPLRVQLQLPDALEAGREQRLTFHVTDAETNEPVNTLDEYLGAAGHLVMIDQSTQIYVHTHPAGHDMDAMSGMTMTMDYGPDIEFETEFPATGLYALWLQIQYKGEVYTAPFVVDVTGVAEPQPEVTHEAHSHG